MAPMVEVRPLPDELTDAGARLLSEAFIDYPAFLAIGSGRPAHRQRLIRRTFAGEMAIARRFGGQAIAAWRDGQPVAVAIVFDPGHHVPPVRAIAHHLDYVLFGPGAVIRGLRVLTAMRRAHLDEPHVWLNALGVHPAQQRSGAGGVLVKLVVQRSQELGVPAFLHTTRPENPAYYRRFGFDVVHEGALPRGKRFWSMLRPL